MARQLLAAAVMAGVLAPAAAQESYTVDPAHTFPSFEVSHGGGFTISRGLFQKSAGTITLDRATRTGSIEIIVDTASIATGLQRRDNLLRAEWFKVDQFPQMIYRSKQLKFSGENLVGADGELTLLGVTKPVNLTIISFKCRPHPVNKKEQCGADGTAQIKRSEFGMTNLASAGDEVRILFQIEAYKD